MTTQRFEEHQFFRQTWLGSIMLSVLALTGASVAFIAATTGHSAAWIAPAILLATALLLLSAKMTVEVDAEVVRIRFFPLWKKTIPLADVVSFEARTYRPIIEYGGWGIRYTFSNGWAYNVGGNRGVQLELANGKRILIGSQRADELAQAIAEAKRLA